MIFHIGGGPEKKLKPLESIFRLPKEMCCNTLVDGVTGVRFLCLGIFPRCGHWLTLARPGEINRAGSEFLARE
jgi:pimeloyl-ACP methyl ester carboxylesterase